MEELKIHGKYKKEDGKKIMRIINEIKVKGMQLARIFGNRRSRRCTLRQDRHSERRWVDPVLWRQKCGYPRKIQECTRRPYVL